MSKLTSIEDLRELQERLTAQRERVVPTLVIPAGTCAQASGANDILRILKKEILARRLTDGIRLRVTGCHGFCEMEPSILVEPAGTFYPKLKTSDVGRILDAVTSGGVVRELLYVDPASKRPLEKQSEIPFFSRQVRSILSRNERVDPIRIFHYMETGGYGALAKALSRGSPDWVVKEIKASGLRGRGGAGFPTGLKWELLSRQPVTRGKVLVCNADEGDPGAYMDRSVLEGNPHSIIEGMLIGAYATGATEGVVYVRNEYPLAIRNLIVALRQANEAGLLGQNILGTEFSFDIRMVRGAGAFVCGEETALIRSVEGLMGEPRQRPPFPIERGIKGKPTAINNVETWANVPIIIAQGADQYARTGTAKNTGTKIFSLVGKVRNTGLVEVPMGITIHDIIYEIGGGPSGDSPIKAVQTGGPSGGCIPADRFDLPIDYDSLSEAGTIMGSGGMIVMDQNTCMVDLARYFMHFLKDESCGKCFPCRKGTQRMYEILDGISKGEGDLSQIDLLEELSQVVKDATMCGLGQTASNPVLSTLRYFKEEYRRHIWDKKCDAFVCKDLVGAPCQSACPIGTEAWRYVAHISRGEYEQAYQAIRETNPFPSVCARVCDHNCESRCRLGTTGNRSVAIRALKRFVTDRVDPSVYKPRRLRPTPADAASVAVIGAGPAGLTAAHNLSLRGYKVTVIEADDEPGGMLIAGVPEYRLPHDVMRKEIASLLDENITVRCKTALGREVTIDGLFAEGHKAVFLAMGAHRSRKLGIDGEGARGVHPAMPFLRAFNLTGESLARGHVGVIGGGNSAIDAARVALRQPGVQSVTIYYRRSRTEMPAFPSEIEEALQEGVQLVTLVSPTRVLTDRDQITGVELIRNELGKLEPTGRRSFSSVAGTEHVVKIDTLIAAIGEQLHTFDPKGSEGVEISRQGNVVVDAETLQTTRAGVFAGGDAVTGPNSVVNAIAAGRKVAVTIDRYLRQEELRQPSVKVLPEAFVEPVPITPEELEQIRRAEPPTIPMEKRKSTFQEVELTLSEEDAKREAIRCLRCDLDFTRREPPTVN